jgi:hypothetical protein
MVWMVGTNLEARGLYVPQAGVTCAIPFLTFSLFSAAPKSVVTLASHRPEYLAAGATADWLRRRLQLSSWRSSPPPLWPPWILKHLLNKTLRHPKTPEAMR